MTPEPERRYQTPAGLRAALDRRLTAWASARAIDVGRLRRQVAFERLLVRLASDTDGWVLKGGLALELRLDGQFRTTRDLDLAAADAVSDEIEVRRRLVTATAEDPYGDGFSFAVGEPRPLAVDRLGRPGWRFPVDVRLAGSSFVKVRLDVVTRAAELLGSVEDLTFRSMLAFAGLPPLVTVPAIDLAQHAAEKLHALTRDYGDRPNTRTKDLVDLVLLVEHDLIDPEATAERIRTVFALRDTHPMPPDLPEPPAGWERDYAALSVGLDLSANTVAYGWDLVRELWSDCLAIATTS